MSKSGRQIMEILEAFDLTRCAHAAAQLTGVDPKTVARYVAIRDAGGNPFDPAPRAKIIDPFVEKIEELVERSHGRVRADVVHGEHLVPMGFGGDERTTRRAVAGAKTAYAAGHRRTYRPWIPEPGMWALCGIPHRNQYEEPGTMRNGGLLGDVVAAQGGCDGLIDST
jgi:hypothetical protein